MLIKFLIFTAFLLSVNLRSFAKEADPYVMAMHDKKYLKIPGGKEVILARLFNDIGPSNHIRFFLREKGKILWDVTYNGDFETLWADAHFIPLYNKEYITDLDHDGFSEIAVAIWHGGHAMEHCRAIIFTIKENNLAPLASHEINYEFSRSVFKNKGEANLKIQSHKGF